MFLHSLSTPSQLRTLFYLPIRIQHTLSDGPQVPPGQELGGGRRGHLPPRQARVRSSRERYVEDELRRAEAPGEVTGVRSGVGNGLRAEPSERV